MMSVKVCILSSIKFVNKIEEDILLKNELLKYYDCDIVAWETLNKEVINEYSVFIIKSVWGYHTKYTQFLKLLKHLDNLGKIIFNKYKSIVFDISKINQNNFMQKNGIPTIPTFCIDKRNDFKVFESLSTDFCVIKPSISASGDNTYKIKVDAIKKNAKVCRDLKKNNKEVLVQPYIDSIQSGEISCIIVNDEFQYAVKRYPGVLISEKSVEYIESIDNKVIQLVNYIIRMLKAYDLLFYRVDLVKSGDEYLVIELEMIDPDLFIKKLPEDLKHNVVKKIAETINRKISKIGD